MGSQSNVDVCVRACALSVLDLQQIGSLSKVHPVSCHMTTELDFSLATALIWIGRRKIMDGWVLCPGRLAQDSQVPY